MEYSDIYIKRIRRLCEARGIAINKLATMSGVSQSTLDNIVRGITRNPGVKTLHKLANAMNMTLAEFLDFQELNDYSFDDADSHFNRADEKIP
ncbi:MAG: helix-turn-helix transcriptional regulator [Clostridia bacterium]|nr:helix-turn-helix transcriptional regulator [Clostridia bacterium]MBR1812183.1 helix-turn-helix transcriptional regulator [Clostridia bacterium]